LRLQQRHLAIPRRCRRAREWISPGKSLTYGTATHCQTGKPDLRPACSLKIRIWCMVQEWGQAPRERTCLRRLPMFARSQSPFLRISCDLAIGLRPSSLIDLQAPAGVAFRSTGSWPPRASHWRTRAYGTSTVEDCVSIRRLVHGPHPSPLTPDPNPRHQRGRRLRFNAAPWCGQSPNRCERLAKSGVQWPHSKRSNGIMLLSNRPSPTSRSPGCTRLP
jgi:hypothetical protein